MFQDYFNLFFYIGLWLFSTFLISRYCERFSTSWIIVVVYTAFSFITLSLYSNPYFQDSYTGLSFFPFVYLFLFVIVACSPIFRYDMRSPGTIVAPSPKILKLFVIFYFVVCAVVLPNDFTNVQEGIVRLMSDSTAGAELYAEAHNAEKKSYSAIYSIMAAFHNCFFEPFIFIAFLMLCNEEVSKKYLRMVFLIVIFEMLSPLAAGLRTITIMKSFTMVAATSFFFPFWTKEVQNTFRRCAIIGSIIIMLPFLAVSISRFGERQMGASGGMVCYAGQAPLNFNLYCLDTEQTREGDRTLNIFKKWVGGDVPEQIMETRSKYSAMKIGDEVFSTWVGDFVLDFGPVVPVIALLIFVMFITVQTRVYNDTFYSYQLLLLYFISNVVLHGAMYLFYYSFNGNYTIVSFMLSYFFLMFCHRKLETVEITR